MARQTEWEFLDDRGRRARADHTPTRLVAYIQAGATLFDHGIRPAGLFGSNHDGDTADPAKAGALPLADIAYLGSGAALDADTLLRSGPDLVVAVAYGTDQVYGLDPEAVKYVEERVPVVVLDVGQGRSLGDVRDRFTALAKSLGAAAGSGTAEYERAERRLRSVAASASAAGLRVLAMSPAAPDSVHLARPHAWPDLRALTEHGISLVEPAPGPGLNWSTVDWTAATSLRPDIVLTDVRVNALPPDGLGGIDARVVPWNPEIACSHAAHARFFEAVADAVEAGKAG
ncbi:ABC transporter substrate-binding protein [Streptomyces sp. NPDC020681]|uniref:ABC transporter substrate-binding protein n=1 Tax=Streptomyces sp. NPDC020681 TaxID=3365083 RepID=UPI00379BFB71